MKSAITLCTTLSWNTNCLEVILNIKSAGKSADIVFDWPRWWDLNSRTLNNLFFPFYGWRRENNKHYIDLMYMPFYYWGDVFNPFFKMKTKLPQSHLVNPLNLHNIFDFTIMVMRHWTFIKTIWNLKSLILQPDS
jgi:hypothetical protein